MIGAGHFLSGLAAGVLTGGVIATLITYWLLMPSSRLRSLQAFYEGKQAALSEISMERIVNIRQKGIVRKTRCLVIQERLLNNKLPMSPFWEHEFLIVERLDGDDLAAITGALATVADRILGLADLRTMVLELIKARVGKKLDARKKG
jgi:hypothetical protein